MKTDKNKVIRCIICILSLCLSGVMLFFFSDALITLAADVALESAKTFLPQKGLHINPPAPTTTAPVTTAGPSVTKPAEPATTTAEKESTTEKSVSTVKELEFNRTDKDILDLMKEAEKKSKKDKEDGKISEYTYKNDGVTDKYGLVRVKNVNNKTGIDIKKLLETKSDLTVKKDEPAVLIFHTHTTETYEILDRGFYAIGHKTRSNDSAVNMVRVGEEIVREIESAGYKVIHDKVIHDSSYNGAYAHSRKSVETYLEKYPSIKVVLDIHRDAIQRSDGTKIKPTATVDGKKAAQIMIISGCQEEGGPIEGFPNWKKNLVFAVELQNTLEELFEGITRPLYFSPRKYNMDLTDCSLLVEIGSDANTLDEAVYTGRCLGKAVSKILEKYEE
ncbi:MAG: stage II sporulation protein P [Clostridia bacterium]|nr:stage II sporulation protein P [Clostridia bacterium]